MEEWIKKSDVVKAFEDVLDCDFFHVSEETPRERIEAIPSADRPKGEWLPFEFGDERWHKCSCCGTADKYIEYVPRPNGTVGKLVSIRNFCPNCGARMFAKDINVPNKKGADDE